MESMHVFHKQDDINKIQKININDPLARYHLYQIVVISKNQYPVKSSKRFSSKNMDHDVPFQLSEKFL